MEILQVPFMVFAGALIVLFFAWLLYFRHFHIGFGMILVRKQSDGTVWVASRLLGSPAWKHGVQNQSQVLRVDEQDMVFSSDEAFGLWGEEHPLALGKKERWIFSGGIVANLEPTLITQKIPVYWSPNDEELSSLTNRGMTNPGLEYCKLTGQYVKKGRISIQALKEAFFGG